MSNFPEFNNLIADVKPLLNSSDFLLKSYSKANKKNSDWGDVLTLVLATINFGYQAKKTIDDFNNLVDVVKNPKPAPTLIDARRAFL